MTTDGYWPGDSQTAAPPPPETDPTLSALVPRRSPVRNAVLGLAAALVLVGAWLSPNLRPDVAWAGDSTGSWSALPDGVLTMLALDVAGWPPVEVRSVAAVPGAEVAGAWVFSGPPTGQAPIDGPALDQVRAMFADHDLERAALPAPATDGGSLVILWTVTDCEALVEGQPAVVTLRTPLGLTAEVEIGDLAGPAFDLETLVDGKTCPKTS